MNSSDTIIPEFIFFLSIYRSKLNTIFGGVIDIAALYIVNVFQNNL